MAKRIDVNYAELLRFRTALRRFDRWSEAQARAAGVTPAQHQLLLAVRGHRDLAGPTIGDISEYLMLRPHSVVELVDRTVRADWFDGTPMTTMHGCLVFDPHHEEIGF